MCRRGFTLLELLLAAGLTTFVIATLLTAIGFVARTETSSSTKIELTRVGTALLNQMRRDLGGVVVLAEQSDETETRFVDSDEAVDAEAVEDLSVFLGSAESFSMVTEIELTQDTLLAEMTEWTAAGAEWDGGLGPKRRLVTWGLVPSEINSDELTVRAASILSPDGYDSLSVSRTVIPEMAECAFRYLGEGEWFETWDSVELGAPPNAVEVTFGLQSVDAEGLPDGEPVLVERVMLVPSGRFPLPEATSEEDGP